MTGFIPDVIKVLREYDLLGFIFDYLKNKSFPSKNRWKAIVKRATYQNDQQDWVRRINQKTGLQFYFASHPVIEVNRWYQVPRAIAVSQIRFITRCYFAKKLNERGSAVLNSLDDVNFVKALLGDCSFFEDKTNLLNMDFLLESAKYISYRLQNSIFDPLEHD